MKRVIKCLGCDKVIREHGSFNVKLKDRVRALLTTEVKEVEVKGRLCRDCAYEAGYKVKRHKQKEVDYYGQTGS